MLFLFVFVFSLLSLLKSLGIEVWMAFYIIEYTISLSSDFCCQLSNCHFFEDNLFLRSLVILRFFPSLSLYDLSQYIDLFLFILLWFTGNLEFMDRQIWWKFYEIILWKILSHFLKYCLPHSLLSLDPN